ncbi:MAG: hypothetical protein K1X57_02150 [Gemmataceae bacterium]|nr:hypothetical protein [Gemmataceae bacterium]
MNESATATATLPAPGDAATCPRCRDGRESYRYYFRGRFEFDVDRARVFTSDGRETVEVDDESVRTSLDRSEYDECHVDHVDPTIPGIIAHVWCTDDDGEEVHGHLLIDGHHRAARCLRDGLPFNAYLLTEEESRTVVQADADIPDPEDR